MRMIAAIAAMSALTFAASAQGPQRFTFQPFEGGVMRLDTETGHVSHCTRVGENLTCRSVADDRAALQEEIDRLRRENEQLRTAGAGKPQAGGALKLPSEEGHRQGDGRVREDDAPHDAHVPR
jgi:hypothetical protein